MASVKRALAWSFTTQYSQMILGFITSVILARLLTPAEIGVFSVAMVVVGFASLLRDFGVSEYLVQEKDLTDTKIQTAYTFNIITGWTMGILLYLASGTIAGFYDDPVVKQVLHILALNFIFVPIGATTFALLRRNMRFGETSRIQLLAMSITAITSVSCAFYGLGATSMAWGALAGAIVTAAGCYFYRYKHIGISFTFKGFSSVWSYSSHSIVLMLTRHTTASLPELLMGKTLGMHDVGIFNKGRSTGQLVYGAVMGGVKPIMMPLFSRYQADHSELRRNFLQALNLSLGIVWPCLALAVYKADELVLFLFGEQWVSSAPILQISAIGIAVWSTATYSEELFKASGKIFLLPRIEFVMLPLTLILATIGSQSSIIVMAALLTLVPFARTLVIFALLRTIYQLQFAMIARILFVNLCLTGLVVVAVVLVDLLAPGMPLLLDLLLAGTVFLMSWSVAVVLFRHSLYLEFRRELLGLYDKFWRLVRQGS